MSIQVATAPVSWGVMEMEGWARQKTYAEVLDEMVQAGYAGTGLQVANDAKLKSFWVQVKSRSLRFRACENGSDYSTHYSLIGCAQRSFVKDSRQPAIQEFLHETMR